MFILCLWVGLCLSLFTSAYLSTYLNNPKSQMFNCLLHALSSTHSFPPSFPIYSLFSAKKAGVLKSKPQPCDWLRNLYRWRKISARPLGSPGSPGPLLSSFLCTGGGEKDCSKCRPAIPPERSDWDWSPQGFRAGKVIGDHLAWTSHVTDWETEAREE